LWCPNDGADAEWSGVPDLIWLEDERRFAMVAHGPWVCRRCKQTAPPELSERLTARMSFELARGHHD
jgi:hypothetical protein